MNINVISPNTINFKRSFGKKFNRIIKVWQLYLLLLVPIAYIIIFKYIPMVGVQLAFKSFDPNKGIWGSNWVGLKYFVRFFGSYQFKIILTNTLTVSFYSLFAGFPMPIILALCLNSTRNDHLKKITQTVTYLPHFISVVVLVGMILQVFNPISGIYGILGRMITGSRVRDILGMASTFPHLYVWSGIWQGMGFASIIYIAALSNVDTELYQAAQVDGATRFQRVLYIDIPSILPTATILLILRAGSIMGVGFEKVFLLQNTMNLPTSEVISTFVYKVGLSSGTGDFSYATAIGLFNSVVNFILIVIVNAITKKFSSTSLW